MKNIYIILAILITATFNIQGQNLSDALRFSTVTPGGTARTIGAGSAFGALGGDFGSISINPAGLGTYRSSEFVLSPGLRMNEVSSIMRGFNESFVVDNQHVTLENLGVVLSHTPMGSDWYSSNLAIGFNKIANFNNDFFYSGKTLGTITERFTFLADGLSPEQLDNFEAYPAYITGAIYDFDEDRLYETDFFDKPDQQVWKEQLVEQRGSINELTLTWGGNYKNKVNVGFGIGVPFFNYQEVKEYSEEDFDNEIDFFDRLSFVEFLNTSATGINFKGGVIFTPVRALRLGLAVQSPTWYFVSDDFSTDLTYAFTDNGGPQEFSEASPFGSFSYRFTTPWRFTASAGTIYTLGELRGFFSADLEYTDYTQGSFNLTSNSNDPSDRTYSRELNTEINNQLATATTLRLGTELAYQNIRFRGGYIIQQSIFTADDKATEGNFSLGFGFRADRFFFDVGYVGQSRAEGYIPYLTNDPNREQLVENDISNDNLVATVGYKF